MEVTDELQTPVTLNLGSEISVPVGWDPELM
jgi:hypothetical protein